MTRCSWCEREATEYVGAAYIPRCCDAEPCREASSAVNHALWDWRDQSYGRARPAGARSLRALAAAEDAAEERDARELRGEPPDMSGWTIFDGSAP